MTVSSILIAQRLRLAIAKRVFCRCLELQIRPGQCWGLLGRNGAGKTTLLHTLAGLQPPTAGQLLLDGMELARLSRPAIAQRIGLLLQHHTLNFPISVESVVLAGLYAQLGLWGTIGRAERVLASKALTQVGIYGQNDRLVTTLSGGEQQRVHIAALLVQNPQLMLLDEPLAHLDLAGQYQVLNLLRHLTTQGHAVVMSLHDPNQALFACSHLLLLQRGRALAGPLQQLGNAKILGRLFGIALQEVKGPHGMLLAPQVTC